MNPAAALSRSLSGKHLSFRSNLHGLGIGIKAHNSPAATRRGVRRLSRESLSFGSRLYTNERESNCIPREGQFGFDYAKERLEKRQMFLRSYHFTTKAEESRSSNSTFSQKGKACLYRFRTALWTVIACSPPRPGAHRGFVRIHSHANPSSSPLSCEQRW